MKSRMFLIYLLAGMVIAASLSGCIISSSPNPLAIIEMRPGETKLFEVKGPVNSSMTKCVWSVGRMDSESYSELEYVNEVSVLSGENIFEFTADPEGEKTNRIRITCDYWSYKYIVPVFCPQGNCEPYWSWVLINSTSWDIRVLQNTAPVWQGNYYIEESRDVELLKDYTAIAGSLVVRGKVKSLEGLDSLTSIGRSLCINGGYKKTLMTSLSGLRNITSIGGDLYIENNEALKSLSGLQNIKSIGRDLEILGDNSLTDLSGLDGLTSVGRDLNIQDNAALSSLSGLQGIASVSGNLRIWSNAALTALGMTDLQKVDGDFEITDNPLLCTSLAVQLQDQVLSRGGIGGTVYIKNNKDYTGP
ncbi:MAG TPA: hypothetical protein VIS94_03185 [Desulfomonilia bacterium]